MKIREWVRQNWFPLAWYAFLTICNSAISGWNDQFAQWVIVQILLSLLFLLDVRIPRSSLSILLCASIAFSPHQARAQDEGGSGGGAPAVVAIVVVCAGGYCVYKIAQFCQKHFPKNQTTTNSPPDSLTGDASDSEAASFNLGNLGSCAGLDEHPPVTFAINGIIYPGDVRRSAWAVCSITASAGKEAAMSWSQLVAEAQSYGVKVTGVGDGSSYYARNGKPISEAESSIHYDPQTKKVSVYSDVSKVHRLIVQRSKDLIYWEVFMHLEMEENRNFQILDTTVEGQMFYRMTVLDGD